MHDGWIRAEDDIVNKEIVGGAVVGAGMEALQAEGHIVVGEHGGLPAAVEGASTPDDIFGDAVTVAQSVRRLSRGKPQCALQVQFQSLSPTARVRVECK